MAEVVEPEFLQPHTFHRPVPSTRAAPINRLPVVRKHAAVAGGAASAAVAASRARCLVAVLRNVPCAVVVESRDEVISPAKTQRRKEDAKRSGSPWVFFAPLRLCGRNILLAL